MKRVGVLALQGAFAEHAAALSALGADVVLVRQPRHLDGLDGLIIPGGESTTIARLMALYGLTAALKEKASQGFPVFGTCAGLILLAKKVPNLDRDPLGVLDIHVLRNAYGRQVDSFETQVPVSALGTEPFPAVFIRAPVIEDVGPSVEVLARLDSGPPVVVRQGNLLGTTFHPELTCDRRLHAYFLRMTNGHGPAEVV